MNKSQLQILADELADESYAEYGQDYPSIAAALNERPETANPTPQGQTPKRLTLSAFFRAAATADPAGAITATATFRPLMEMTNRAVIENDRTAMQDYLSIFSSQLNPTGDAALAALLAETEPDPAWSATVLGDSRATTLGLPVVHDMDVQLALHPELWNV